MMKHSPIPGRSEAEAETPTEVPTLEEIYALRRRLDQLSGQLDAALTERDQYRTMAEDLDEARCRAELRARSGEKTLSGIRAVWQTIQSSENPPEGLWAALDATIKAP